LSAAGRNEKELSSLATFQYIIWLLCARHYYTCQFFWASRAGPEYEQLFLCVTTVRLYIATAA
jgi:hypothetical protein